MTLTRKALLAGVGAVLIGLCIGVLVEPLVFRGRSSTSPDGVVQAASHLVTASDDWSEQIKSPAFWAKSGGRTSSLSRAADNDKTSRLGRGDDRPTRSTSLSTSAPTLPSLSNRSSTPAKRNADEEEDDGDSSSSSGDKTYRTVCVRLCDGFFTPISFSTTRSKFKRDEKACEAMCPGAGRLFVYRNPGSDVGDMEDLNGTAYRKLATANLYKTSYDAACKCRPHAWEQVSLDRHKIYALEASKAKSEPTVRAEIDALTKRVKQSERDAATERADRLKAQKAADAEKAKLRRTEKSSKRDNGRTADAANAPTSLAAAMAMAPQPAGEGQIILASVGSLSSIRPAPERSTEIQPPSAATLPTAKSLAAQASGRSDRGIKPVRPMSIPQATVMAVGLNGKVARSQSTIDAAVVPMSKSSRLSHLQSPVGRGAISWPFGVPSRGDVGRATLAR